MALVEVGETKPMKLLSPLALLYRLDWEIRFLLGSVLSSGLNGGCFFGDFFILELWTGQRMR